MRIAMQHTAQYISLYKLKKSNLTKSWGRTNAKKSSEGKPLRRLDIGHQRPTAARPFWPPKKRIWLNNNHDTELRRLFRLWFEEWYTWSTLRNELGFRDKQNPQGTRGGGGNITLLWFQNSKKPEIFSKQIVNHRAAHKKTHNVIYGVYVYRQI